MTSRVTKDLICAIFNAEQVLREKARVESNLTDCSFLHLHTLHYVAETGPVKMKEIANFLHITPPSATSVINSLVKRRFIVRVGDEVDRRTIKLQITKIGGELLKNSFARMMRMVENNINKLSESEKKIFLSILNKISK